MASSPVAAEMMNAVINTSAVGRIGEPEEVAALVSFLASDAAGFITGKLSFVLGYGGSLLTKMKLKAKRCRSMGGLFTPKRRVGWSR